MTNVTNPNGMQKASSSFEQKRKGLAELRPSEIASDPRVEQKFVQLYELMHGQKNGEVYYQSEKFHFGKLIQEKQELQDCDPMSLYGCFLDVAVNGLSFDPGMKQVYLVPFNTNVGTKDNPRWIKKCQLMVSPYGELYLRARSGQIKYADNPVLVYQGDDFSTGTTDGKVYVEHKAKFPRQSDEIIACYLRIVRADDTVDYKVMSTSEILKLKSFSKQQNSLAWTAGLPGMIQAKTIKHAFRSYPRVRTRGQFTQIETDIDETIDYSFEETPPVQIPATATSSSSSSGRITTPNENAGAPSAEAKVVAASMTAGETGTHKLNADDDIFN